MSDYVVYHNPDRMGYPASEVDVLAIVTNKPATGAKGARVWLITRGKPKQYWLRGIFTVDSVERSSHPKYRTQVAGRAGTLFDPMLRLDEEPWFDEFKNEQGNFAFGFQPINNPAAVKGLQAVAERSKPGAPGIT
jgi:hypothetical protein